MNMMEEKDAPDDVPTPLKSVATLHSRRDSVGKNLSRASSQEAPQRTRTFTIRRVKSREIQQSEKKEVKEDKKNGPFASFQNAIMKSPIFGRSKGKNDDKVNTSPSPDGSPILDVNTFEDLPKELQKVVKKSNISKDLLTNDDNFLLLLNILQFQTKSKFKKVEQQKELEKENERARIRERKREARRLQKEAMVASQEKLEGLDTITTTPDVAMDKTDVPSYNSQGSNSTGISFASISKSTSASRPMTDLHALLSPPDRRNHYKIIKEEGKGGFGTVFAGLRRGDEKKKVAIKVTPYSEKDKRFNITELSFLSTYRHPNIVDYFESFIVDETVWCILEHLEGGTLEHAIDAYQFSETNIAYIAKEILKGVAYMHSQQLAHRDLKTANIMMTIQGDIKLIDFGLCADLSVQKQKTSMVGSPLFMSPEMIQRKPHDAKCDIWSLGVCIRELANGHSANHKSSIKSMFVAATEGIPQPFDKPQRWTNTFKDFIAKCLESDPVKRATADELLNHAFVASADSTEHMVTVLKNVFALKQVLIF